MNVARACEPASARLSLQAMRLSYFKNSDFAASLQITIIMLCAISDICVQCVCVRL